MPAKSKAQQSVFGIALAARRGEVDPGTLFGAARKLYRDSGLSESDLEEYASTKKADLPKHVGAGRPHVRARR